MTYFVTLLFKLFRLPAIAQMLLAIPCFAVTFWCFGQSAEQQRALAVALNADTPEAIDIKDFDRNAPRAFGGEVNLVVRLDTEFNTILTQSRNGITTAERAMFVLFDKNDSLTETKARGVILIDPDDADQFYEWTLDRTNRLADIELQGSAGYAQRKPVVITLQGARSSSQGVSKVVDKAFDEYGLTKHQQFTYFEPFYNGRAAGLEQSVSYMWVWIWGCLGLVMLALGLYRLFEGRLPERVLEPKAPAPITRSRQSLLSMPEGATNNVKDGPLARILEREKRDQDTYFSAQDAQELNKAQSKSPTIGDAIAPKRDSVVPKAQGLRREHLGAVASFAALIFVFWSWLKDLPVIVLGLGLIAAIVLVVFGFKFYSKRKTGSVLPVAPNTPKNLPPFSGTVDHDPFQDLPKITVPADMVKTPSPKRGFEDHLEKKRR